MTQIWDTIVIGGGQAGLASGYYLQYNKLQFLILEANDQAIGSWPQYYDSLKLFSPSRFSSLPGMKFSGNLDHYPLRDEVIHYLQNYTKHFHFPIKTNQRVNWVEKKDNLFFIRTISGDTYFTRTIINATGSFHSPFKPVINGQEAFRGSILHSSEYRNPSDFSDQRVVIVGRGNSAVQIGIELADVCKTTLAVREPVQLIKQKILGKDLHFWIRLIGFDVFPFWRFGKPAPISSSVINLGQYKEKLAEGKPAQQPMFISFYTDGVVWKDGTKERIDTVIFATGYRPTIDYLKNIKAVDSQGIPLQVTGVSTSVPGLYYVGLEGQRSFSSATLRGVGPDARFVVRKLIRYLKT